MKDEIHKTLKVLSALPVVGTAPNVVMQVGEHMGYFDKEGADVLTDKELFYDTVHDGIVVNEQLAGSEHLACTCTEGKDKEDICWKKGIIGILSKEQVDKYCPVEHRRYETTDMHSRIEDFITASKSCEIGKYFNDNVIKDIEDRLKCMHDKLQVYNITGLY